MTTETKTMTREELDEAIAELHEPKPCEPLFVDRPARSIFGYWEWSGLCRKWFPHEYSSKHFGDAKRLKDELFKDGFDIFINQIQNVPAQIQFGCKVQRFREDEKISVVASAETEELAISKAYYEAKTGVRVEIKD